MEKLAVTFRGLLEDLYTFGTVVVVDNKGEIIYSKGDVDKLSFPRSSAKLMQAMVPLSLGAKEKFDLTEREISIICASHSGESFHIETVAKLLNKIGLDESYLKCGPHYPFKAEESLRMQKEGEKARDIHNNCSGKHTGMLMSALLLGASLDDYYKLGHPVQNEITRMISNICKHKIGEDKISIDGCGVPVHALPIRNFAHGMARLADYENLPDNSGVHSKIIIEAITKNPKFTSGSDRIDYYLINKYPGKLIVKSGANGYFGGMILDKKWGFAIKTFDGIVENRNIILIALLKKLGLIKEEDAKYFDEIISKDIMDHRGEKVGKVEVLL